MDSLSLSLRNIASAGGSLIVSAKSFDSLSLRNVASAGVKNGANLIIKDANHIDSLSCRNIASANPGHVYFDFT
jgi:hypothetical protein